jgi:DME family drug/metabolite transporter
MAANLSRKGVVLVLLAAMLWGTTGTTQGLAPSGVASSVIGASRLLVGGFVLLVIHLLKNGFHISDDSSSSSLPTSISLIYMLVGIITVAAYQVTFFYGVRLSGVAIGTVIAIGSSPLWAGVLGFFLMKDSPPRIWYISTLLSIAGLSFLVLTKNRDVTFSLSGVVLTLLAGLSYAAYALSAKMLLKRYRPDFIMAIFFLGGAVILSPVLFTHKMDWVFSLKGMIVIIHLGVFATGLSYVLFSRGLRHIPVSTASTLSLAEPLTAAILGVTLLGEVLTIFHIIGMTLVIISLLILAKH